MEIVISSAIGGQIIIDTKIEVTVHQLIIKVRKSLKQHFESKEFNGLDKIKINLYVSGDLSEYCDVTGVNKNRYTKSKKEFSSEFCISKHYWLSEPKLDVQQKFISFMEKSLLDLGIFINDKLKSNKYEFNNEIYNRIILKSLNDL